MKFIHLADTHLGCEIPVEYREIRKKDFVNAFKQVIEFAINNKVDFIIHSGDLFDDYFRISSGILDEIIELFVRLKDEDIPFIAIKGNHDVKGHRQKMFDILKKLKLIQEASPKNPIEIGNCSIYGISEPANIGGEDLTTIYKTLLPKIKISSSNYTIFLFHGAPDIISKELVDPRVVPTEILPKNVDYYALGHFHTKKLLNLENKIFALPGSTEHTEISKLEEKDQKCFYLVKDNKVQEVPIKTRPIYILEKIISTEEEISEIFSHISSKSKETLIKLKLRTSQKLYQIAKLKVERFIDSGFLIIDDLCVDSEDMSVDFEAEKIALEEAFSKLIVSNKEEILELFNKIKGYLDDIFQGDQSDVERLREILRKEFAA